MPDEQRVGPIAIPAGSFDVMELRKNLDQAVSVKNRETHPERIAKAIVDSADELTKKVLARSDQPAIPEHAEIVTRKDGDETIETVAFRPAVDPKTGKRVEDPAVASQMRYERVDANVERDAEVVEAPTLAEVASDVVADEVDKSGKK